MKKCWILERGMIHDDSWMQFPRDSNDFVLRCEKSWTLEETETVKVICISNELICSQKSCTRQIYVLHCFSPHFSEFAPNKKVSPPKKIHLSYPSPIPPGPPSYTYQANSWRWSHGSGQPLRRIAKVTRQREAKASGCASSTSPKTCNGLNPDGHEDERVALICWICFDIFSRINLKIATIQQKELIYKLECEIEWTCRIFYLSWTTCIVWTTVVTLSKGQNWTDSPSWNGTPQPPHPSEVKGRWEKYLSKILGSFPFILTFLNQNWRKYIRNYRWWWCAFVNSYPSFKSFPTVGRMLGQGNARFRNSLPWESALPLR